ncbi:MAG TPA: M28 family peptidase [Candidatus Acidoferrales bacterium]|nr:M28 family peptidase [Candidatus Acidoferrales bacterium]
MMVKSIGLAVLAVAAALAQQGGQEGGLSAERIREHTKFLSSDLMEGRGVGTRGGQLATEYIATQLALAGAKPAGDNGTFFQSVPLVGVETQPNSTLGAAVWGKGVDLKFGDDFVGVNGTQRPDTRFEAETVFVGHGITAPEFQWDDFKGVNVTGKVLVLFTNEPPSDNPKFFDGRALTYYGRWTYKYEEALRRGARGVIIIHTTDTASYGWDVVRSSWGREAPFVKVGPNEKALALQGWVSREAGEKLLALAGKTVDELLAASEKPDFKPIDLGIQVRAHLVSKIRDLETRNVAAIVPGSDPKLKDEAVIYSAHWDHLGIGTPVNGDSIYNGAIDNATGCAVLLEMARAWASLPQKPKRSALFLAVTAEEGGLKGSEYYAAHPLIPPAKTALDLNYDALYPWGRAKDVVITGAERTTVYPLAQQIARRLNLAISPDATPEAGHYFRSDHFSFAHVGIPAFSIEHATEFAGKPAGFGAQAYQEYNSKHYHQPSDEFQPDWDFTALEQAAVYGFLLGRDVANQDKLPGWRPGDQFHR